LNFKPVYIVGWFFRTVGNIYYKIICGINISCGIIFCNALFRF